MKHEKIISTILVILACFAVIFGIKGSVQHYNSGRLSDQLRIELNDAADTNRRLTETIEQCKCIITELRTTTETNITTARQAIEVLEETREAVGALEAELGLWDSDSIYDRIDSWLSGELEVK